LVRAVDS